MPPWSSTIDEFLGRAVAALRDDLGPRLRAVYLAGSHADGTATLASDVDAYAVCEPGLSEAERKALYRRLEVALPDPVAFDLGVLDLGDLRRDPLPGLSHAVLLDGEDVRPSLPPVDLARWERRAMHGAWGFVARSRCLDGPRALALPLDWPVPDAPLRGYDFRTFAHPDGTEEPMVKELVVVSGWVATARAARHGRVVPTKARAPHLVREVAPGPDADFVAEVHARVRAEWGYRIPTDAGARAALESLCTRMLAFEDGFATEYRDWVVRELRDGDAAQAARRLARWGLDDPAVREALGSTPPATGTPTAQTAD